jgi:uracil-DNA glycosylase
MCQHMPKKYWRNMPETHAISEMLRAAPARTRNMIDRGASAPSKRQPRKALPAMLDADVTSIGELNAIIAAAEPLVPGAKRAVLGEGPMHPAIAFVGEQPGDQEDIEGHPFVGPAGQLLTRAMDDAGIDRAKSYLTNAVKHFKYEQRGKRRIHQKPTMGEVKHYRWWLLKELELVRPKLVVALGGTAALALTGRQLSVTKVRGPYELGEFPGYVTVHPSYLLRIPDAAAKKDAYHAFVADLRAARKLAA